MSINNAVNKSTDSGFAAPAGTCPSYNRQASRACNDQSQTRLFLLLICLKLPKLTINPTHPANPPSLPPPPPLPLPPLPLPRPPPPSHATSDWSKRRTSWS